MTRSHIFPQLKRDALATGLSGWAKGDDMGFSHASLWGMGIPRINSSDGEASYVVHRNARVRGAKCPFS